MFYLIFKSTVSGLIVAAVSEIARRNPGLGALVVSLPLISILSMIWLWHDTQDTARLAAHAQATFWFVLPSLPMFLLFPVLLRNGMGFWMALVASCVLTICLYFLMLKILGHFGLSL